MATRYRGLPTPAERARLSTQVKGTEEGLRRALYHYQAYAAAGQAQLAFFGVALASLANGYADTNMEIPSQLPQPQSMVVEGLEVIFDPGVVPGNFGAQQAGTFVNDVYTVYTSPCYLTFRVGEKDYVKEGPLLMFPPKRRLAVAAAAADASTAAAALQTLVNYASASGKPFVFSPPINIDPGQQFGVTITWPALAPLPSGVAGRIGVRLPGIVFRSVQ